MGNSSLNNTYGNYNTAQNKIKNDGMGGMGMGMGNGGGMGGGGNRGNNRGGGPMRRGGGGNRSGPYGNGNGGGKILIFPFFNPFSLFIFMISNFKKWVRKYFKMRI